MYTKKCSLDPKEAIVETLVGPTEQKEPYEILLLLYMMADRLGVQTLVEKLSHNWGKVLFEDKIPFKEAWEDPLYTDMLTTRIAPILMSLYEITPTDNRLRISTTARCIKFIAQFPGQRRTITGREEEILKNVEKVLEMHEPSAFALAEELEHAHRRAEATSSLFDGNGCCQQLPYPHLAKIIKSPQNDVFLVYCLCHGQLDFKEWIRRQ